MNGQPRPGQITYYEQLGVPANASAEEIRDAYRALARLLHPDQQTDPHLKRIADQQMRKLNPIYTVLSDPGRRRQYDEDLDDDYVAPIVLEGAPPAGITKLVARLVWVVAIVIAGSLLYWLAAGGSNSPFAPDQDARHIVPVIIPATNSADGGHSDSEVATLQSQIKTLTAERDFAMHELQRVKGPTAAALPQPTPPPVARASSSAPAFTELPSAQPAPPRVEAAAPKPAAKPTLAGFWFYAAPKGQKNKNQDLYPPEYIEATIIEMNGVFKGKYRSRFQIADRASYPEVNFTFTGSPTNGTLTCPWVGQGGARGEVTMKMTSDNSLRLDWAASELGTQMGLSSGTAILTRKIE